MSMDERLERLEKKFDRILFLLEKQAVPEAIRLDMEHVAVHMDPVEFKRQQHERLRLAKLQRKAA